MNSKINYGGLPYDGETEWWKSVFIIFQPVKILKKIANISEKANKSRPLKLILTDLKISRYMMSNFAKSKSVFENSKADLRNEQKNLMCICTNCIAKLCCSALILLLLLSTSVLCESHSANRNILPFWLVKNFPRFGPSIRRLPPINDS